MWEYSLTYRNPGVTYCPRIFLVSDFVLMAVTIKT